MGNTEAYNCPVLQHSSYSYCRLYGRLGFIGIVMKRGLKGQNPNLPDPIFSALEYKNEKFKKLAWVAGFLFVCVLVVLILELAGVIKY